MERQKERTYTDTQTYSTAGGIYDHHTHWHLCSMRCISWGAILFGAVIAIALGFLFNVFSMALGLTAFPITPEGKVQFAIWGFVYLAIIAYLTMFIAGWITGYLGRTYCYKRTMGELYGFGAWAVALIATIFLASQIGPFLAQRGYTTTFTGSPVKVATDARNAVNETANTLANRNTTPAAENAADYVGMVGFATFFLLFLGALSAAFGGRCGMRYKRKERPENCPTCK